MDVDKPQILNGFISQPNVQYVIPIYQRNYVWKKENINQLLSDIENMINVDGNSKTYHFFGTIVFIETLSNGFFHEYTIIDGQQRLTTIFLILQAMKQVYPDSLEAINESYLFNKPVPGTTLTMHQKYRLKPLVSDDDMYQKISDNNLENLTEEEQNSNLYMRFLQIKKRVELRKKQYDFGTILTAIDRLKIVWIKLDKDEEPQQVFESINSTGVNLTAADLIRNFVLMNKDDATQTKIYNEYRSKIEFIHVKTENLKEFFRFYVSIRKRDTIPDKDVYDLFKAEYENLCKDHKEEDVLANILQYAENYGYIKFGNYSLKSIINSSIIDKALEEYRTMETNMPTIVLMETIKLYRDQKITEDDTEKTIRLLSNYIIRRNLCGEESRYISGAFGNFLGRILKYFKQTGNYYESVLRAIVNDNIGVGPYMPTDAVVKEQFQTSNLYNRNLTSLMLKRIENESNPIQMDTLSVEHVMPQTKTPYWEEKINDHSIYEEVVNRVGNLTLVASVDNSAMSNKDFENKKNRLSDTKHVKMNEYILGKTERNENEIKDRSLMIADKFLSLFPYPDLPADLPLLVNLNEDDEEVFRKAKKFFPIEVAIGNDVTFSVSLWDEAFKKIVKYLYENNPDKFNSCYETANGLKSTTEAGDIEIEVNIEPMTGFRCIQSTIKKMNVEDPIRIIYTKDQPEPIDNQQSLFS